jgi:peptide/nickel transport system substrate-binding protein
MHIRSKMMRTRSLVASTAGLAMLASALAGCAAAAPSSSGVATPTVKTTVYTPAAKGDLSTVTWNIWEGEPNTLNPFQSADYTPNEINSNMCETLFALTPSYKTVPNLAASYSNPNPLTWIYNLRKGVTFWDGTPMTAQDVAFSLNHNLQDSATLYNYLFSDVKSINVTGPLQVTINLNKPDYLLNAEMTDFAGVVVEKKFYEQHAANYGSPSAGVMCTGPFQFASWNKGQNITLTAYSGYWDKARMPKVHKLVFTFLTSESAITAALETGEIDGTYDLPMSGIGELSRSSEGKVYYGPSQNEISLIYTNPKGALGSLKVREALQEAINWNGIAKTVEHGTGEPIREMIPPSIFGTYSPTLNPAYAKLSQSVSNDIAAAKKLVSEAGPAARQTIVMAVQTTPTEVEIGDAVQSAANSIGLSFKLRAVPTVEYQNYLYNASARKGIDIFTTDYWSNTADPLDWIANTAIIGTTQNYYGYTGVNGLYLQAIAMGNTAKRDALMREIMDKTRQDLLPMVPGVYHLNTLFMNNRLTGAPASFDYVYYPWAASLGASS